MARKAKWAKGTKFKWAGNDVSEITNIGGPQRTTDEEDVTSHDSPDGTEEVLMTLKRNGEIPLEGNYDLTDVNGQLALETAYNEQTLGQCEIVLPGGIASFGFEAYVKGINTGFPVNGKIPFNATIRPTGKFNFNVNPSGGLTALTGVDSDAGALAFIPAFNNAVYLYTVAVATGITFIKLTPTAAAHTIKINGAAVTTAQESGEIALGAAGTNTEISIVAKETGKIEKTYKIIVARAAN